VATHPFSCPGSQTLRDRRSIKSVGDFTAAIPRLAPGTPVLIDGPHGVFTRETVPARKRS